MQKCAWLRKIDTDEINGNDLRKVFNQLYTSRNIGIGDLPMIVKTHRTRTYSTHQISGSIAFPMLHNQYRCWSKLVQTLPRVDRNVLLSTEYADEHIGVANRVADMDGNYEIVERGWISRFQMIHVYKEVKNAKRK